MGSTQNSPRSSHTRSTNTRGYHHPSWFAPPPPEQAHSLGKGSTGSRSTHLLDPHRRRRCGSSGHLGPDSSPLQMTRRNGTGTWLAMGGGVMRDSGGWRASRADERKEKGERMGESGVGRGVIQMPGTGRSFYIGPADLDPSWTADLACHVSKSGKCVSFFSLRC